MGAVRPMRVITMLYIDTDTFGPCGMLLPMTIAFEEKRAAQVAAVFLDKAGGTLPLLKLMKLMYLADRRSMDLHGQPITFDSMVSMPQGPVLSMTLNYANGAIESGEEGWEDWISDRAGHDVALKRTGFHRDDLMDLSDADLAVIEDTWNRFGHMSKWQLRDYTHNHLGEWRDPHGSSTPIAFEDVFLALGRTPDEASLSATHLREILCIERRYG